MTPTLSILEVGVMLNVMRVNDRRHGWYDRGRSEDVKAATSRLLSLGYLEKLPPLGMSDYVTRVRATEAGALRLLNPDLLVIVEVMAT